MSEERERAKQLAQEAHKRERFPIYIEGQRFAMMYPMRSIEKIVFTRQQLRDWADMPVYDVVPGETVEKGEEVAELHNAAEVLEWFRVNDINAEDEDGG